MNILRPSIISSIFHNIQGIPLVSLDAPAYSVLPGKFPLVLYALNPKKYFYRIKEISLAIHTGDKIALHNSPPPDWQFENTLNWNLIPPTPIEENSCQNLNAKIILENKRGRQFTILNSNLSSAGPALTPPVISPPLPYPQHSRVIEFTSFLKATGPTPFEKIYHNIGADKTILKTLGIHQSINLEQLKHPTPSKEEGGGSHNIPANLDSQPLFPESDAPSHSPDSSETSAISGANSLESTPTLWMPQMRESLSRTQKKIWIKTIDELGYADSPNGNSELEFKTKLRNIFWPLVSPPLYRHHSFLRGLWVKGLLSDFPWHPLALSHPVHNFQMGSRLFSVPPPFFSGCGFKTVILGEGVSQDAARGLAAGSYCTTQGPYLELKVGHSTLEVIAKSNSFFGPLTRLEVFSGSRGEPRENLEYVLKDGDSSCEIARTIPLPQTLGAKKYVRAEARSDKGALALTPARLLE